MTMESDLVEGLTRDYAPRRRRQEDAVSNLRLAQDRAHELKSFAQPGRPGWFWVHGYDVQVRDGEVVYCSCPSWELRGLCKHGERVNQRRDI